MDPCLRKPSENRNTGTRADLFVLESFAVSCQSLNIDALCLTEDYVKLLWLQEKVTVSFLQDESGDILYFCYCQQVPQEGKNIKGVTFSLSVL